jgi:phosphoribosylformylglycinamidine (FGAM) synthase PurS component
MPIYKFITHFINQDPRSTGYLKEAQALGFRALRQIVVHDLYFIEGQLSQENCKQLALKLLTDSVTQSAEWMEVPTPPSTPEVDSVILEVALRPGVTDPVAEQIVRWRMNLALTESTAPHRQRFIQLLIHLHVRESVTESVYKLFANLVIHHWTIGDITPSFRKRPNQAAQSRSSRSVNWKMPNSCRLQRPPRRA